MGEERFACRVTGCRCRRTPEGVTEWSLIYPQLSTPVSCSLLCTRTKRPQIERSSQPHKDESFVEVPVNGWVVGRLKYKTQCAGYWHLTDTWNTFFFFQNNFLFVLMFSRYSCLSMKLRVLADVWSLKVVYLCWTFRPRLSFRKQCKNGLRWMSCVFSCFSRFVNFSCSF